MVKFPTFALVVRGPNQVLNSGQNAGRFRITPQDRLCHRVPTPSSSKPILRISTIRFSPS
jgi:hypothetical protein